jgi:hypothetical protein
MSEPEIVTDCVKAGLQVSTGRSIAFEAINHPDGRHG